MFQDKSDNIEADRVSKRMSKSTEAEVSIT